MRVKSIVPGQTDVADRQAGVQHPSGRIPAPSLDDFAADPDQLPREVELEVPGPRVLGQVGVSYDEKAFTLDGGIQQSACVLNSSLLESSRYGDGRNA